MNLTTGPPDWNAVLERSLIIILLYFAALPVVITLDDLSGRNPHNVYISQNA